MHLVWSHPTTGAELWCGGMNAGKDASFMKQNGINCTLSAASCPPMAQDSRIKNFGQYDGTGVVAGHWPWETIKSVVNSVIAELCDGKRVLIACRNGTGRSATWCALVLMALTGDLPGSVCDHLVAIRSVVQFACHTLSGEAPAASSRQNNLHWSGLSPSMGRWQRLRKAWPARWAAIVSSSTVSCHPQGSVTW